MRPVSGSGGLSKRGGRLDERTERIGTGGVMAAGMPNSWRITVTVLERKDG